MDKVKGYDSPQLLRQDTLERIERLQPELNSYPRKMNDIIRENNLQEKLLPEPFPEEEDDECE